MSLAVLVSPPGCPTNNQLGKRFIPSTVKKSPFKNCVAHPPHPHYRPFLPRQAPWHRGDRSHLSTSHCSVPQPVWGDGLGVMNSLEAKVVILGAQGAGKTSLVVRFVENNFHRNLQSTIGASFLVKKVYFSLVVTSLRQSSRWLYRTVTGCFRSWLSNNRFGIQRDKNDFDRW